MAKKNNAGVKTVEMTETMFGYTLTEAGDRFSKDLMIEGALRIIGMMFMLAAYAQMFMPRETWGTGPLGSHAFVMILLTTVGITIYAFATRGFRREFGVNLATREVRIQKLNGSGNSRITMRVPFAQIESFYVRRDAGKGEAALYIRKRSVPTTVCLLRGQAAEIEAIHARLCADIQVAPAEALGGDALLAGGISA